jgi:aminoglycoside phosphotransferase (APT) family kinase protein
VTSEWCHRLAPDAALPTRDALLAGDPAVLPFTVGDVEVVRCKYRVGESLRVVYRCGGGRVVTVRASAGRPLRWWEFPDDRRLTGIGDLLAPGPALQAAAGGAAGSAAWVRSEVVEYAPERSLTVRALHADGGIVAYAKHYAPGTRDVAALAGRYAAVAGHLGDGLAAPRPLGCRRDVLVLAAMPGERWADVGAGHATDVARRLGRAIASVHAMPVPAGTPVFDRLAPDRLIAAACAVTRARPDLGDVPAALVDRLVDRRSEDAAVFLHGDCHPKNAIVDGADLALIDLDQAGTGPAAADIGSLMARLRVGTITGRHDVATEHATVAAFLAGYDAVRALPAARSLRWHTAAALVGEQAVRAVNRVRADVLAELPAVLAAAQDLAPGRPR